jgi:hypothetical protein
VERRRLDRPVRPIVAPCRQCSSPQIVALTRIEMVDGDPLHRCRACGELSALRREDAVVLGLVPREDQGSRG